VRAKEAKGTESLRGGSCPHESEKGGGTLAAEAQRGQDMA